jgi:hypothetical protein
MELQGSVAVESIGCIDDSVDLYNYVVAIMIIKEKMLII